VLHRPPVDLLCRYLVRELLRESFSDAPADAALAS